jgi:ribosome-associated protein
MRQQEFRITTEFIELNQLLKVSGLAASGGAGGALVSEGNVTVDGRPETRKRCKIRPGQVVQMGSVRITVLAADAAAIAEKAAARMELAKRKGEKRRAKAAAPWTPRTGAKPGPKARRVRSVAVVPEVAGVTAKPATKVARTAGAGETAKPAAKRLVKKNAFAAMAENYRPRTKR